MTVWLCSTRPWIWTLTCEFIQVSSVMKLYSSFDFSQLLGIEKILNLQKPREGSWSAAYHSLIKMGLGASVTSSGKRSKLILAVGETQDRGDPRVSRRNQWSLRFLILTKYTLCQSFHLPLLNKLTVCLGWWFLPKLS